MSQEILFKFFSNSFNGKKILVHIKTLSKSVGTKEIFVKMNNLKIEICLINMRDFEY